MSKRKHQQQADVAVLEAPAPVAEQIEAPIALCMGETIDEIDDQIEADVRKSNSVVKSGYKTKYRDRANEAGIARKAAKRSTWDWLASTLAGECLGAKDKIDIAKFTAILEANGVDHSRWTNRSKGWEGRFRMTGRLALQRVVAEAGVMKVADGEELVAPVEWVAKFKN